MNRLAASPEIVEAITSHFRSDGVPPGAATHLAAEMAMHPQDIDTSIEKFQTYFANFVSQGFSQDTAQHLAVEALESGHEPHQSRRFQLLNED